MRSSRNYGKITRLFNKNNMLKKTKTKAPVSNNGLLNFFIVFWLGVLTGALAVGLALVFNSEIKGNSDASFLIRSIPTPPGQIYQIPTPPGQLNSTLSTDVLSIPTPEGQVTTIPTPPGQIIGIIRSIFTR